MNSPAWTLYRLVMRKRPTWLSLKELGLFSGVRIMVMR